MVRTLGWLSLVAWLALHAAVPSVRAEGSPSMAGVIQGVQPQMVKIFGAGGLAGLEAYQSGFLISPDGHVLTVWSYVLDTDYITVTLDDGRKFNGTLVGADPRYEIAILKIEAEQLPYFSLLDVVELSPGDRVLTFSNLFGVAVGDEPTSVLHGCVAALADLDARRGAFETNYRGPVYVLDAITNNPGAAGGVLTDRKGRLAGLLGKELRSAQTNIWLNYAIPIQPLIASVDDILAGKTLPRTIDDSTRKPAEPWTLGRAGVSLVPDVLSKTPPFVDAVRAGSPAAAAGLQPDDLVLFVNSAVASSITNVLDELSLVDRIDPVRLTVQRGRELIEVTIQPNNDVR
jgi:S1-C subfamily serine protease